MEKNGNKKNKVEDSNVLDDAQQIKLSLEAALAEHEGRPVKQDDEKRTAENESEKIDAVSDTKEVISIESELKILDNVNVEDENDSVMDSVNEDKADLIEDVVDKDNVVESNNTAEDNNDVEENTVNAEEKTSRVSSESKKNDNSDAYRGVSILQQTEEEPEIEPATAYESKPDAVDVLSSNLEMQLDQLVGYVPDNSMDSKIDSAIEKIINDTVGDIPEEQTAATQQMSEPEKKDIEKAEKVISTSSVVDDSIDEKARKKAERQREKEAKKAIKQQEKADRKSEKLQEKAYRIEQREENPEEYTRKKKKRNKIIIAIASLLLLTVVCVYGGFAYHFKDLFFKGTMINGFDCSELTVDQAESLIRNQVEDYSISMAFRDGSAETIDGSDIEYKYVSDGGVQRIKDSQNPLLWIRGLFAEENYEVGKAIEYNADKLQEKYRTLASLADEAQVAPTDAYVAYQDTSFVIVPETEGNQFDRDALLNSLNEAVAASATELNVESLEVYTHPAVYQDAPQLQTECDQLNQLANVSVTYQLPQGNKVLDGNVMKEWLTVDEAGNYSISDDSLAQHIKEYVATLAEETNTIGKSRPFHATAQGDITVSGGSYGWKVDQSTEIAQLKKDIANHTVTTREPAYSSREVTTDNNGFGGTYIDVDLSNQHLWYYVNGSLYLESDFVSGTATKSDRKTPAGLFLLAYKQRDKVLRGQQRSDGSYEYESPVKYWMPFNGGIGFHDASWRGSFGGSIYKYSGSHGCINLPTKKAAAMYEIIDKQTPIILYY